MAKHSDRKAAPLPEHRELGAKIKEFVKTGAYDRISEQVAEYVSRKIEQSLTAKKAREV